MKSRRTPNQYSAKAILHHDDEVLLLQKANRKWDLPGGRYKPGEYAVAAMLRELDEEIGGRNVRKLAAGPIEYVCSLSRQKDNGVNQTKDYWSIATPDTISLKRRYLSGEHRNAAWVPVSEVLEMVQHPMHAEALQLKFDNQDWLFDMDELSLPQLTRV